MDYKKNEDFYRLQKTREWKGWGKSILGGEQPQASYEGTRLI